MKEKKGGAPDEPVPPCIVPVYRIVLVRESGVPTTTEQIRSSADAAALFRPLFRDLDREHFAVMLLDAKHRVTALNVVSVGSLTSTIVHPREAFKAALADEEMAYGPEGELFRRAVRANAAALILGHNHPSGDPTPSGEDIEITRRIRQAGETLGIRVLDHVIVGEGRHFSFSDAGYW